MTQVLPLEVQEQTVLLTSPSPSLPRRGDPKTTQILPLTKGELEGVLSHSRGANTQYLPTTGVVGNAKIKEKCDVQTILSFYTPAVVFGE